MAREQQPGDIRRETVAQNQYSCYLFFKLFCFIYLFIFTLYYYIISIYVLRMSFNLLVTRLSLRSKEIYVIFVTLETFF